MKNKDLRELLQKYPDDMDVVLNSNNTTYVYIDDIEIAVIETRYCDGTELFFKMDNLDDEDWRRETKEVLMIY